jgi:hypothetical protein
MAIIKLTKVVATDENTIVVSGITATEESTKSPFIIGKSKVHTDPHHVVAESRELVIEKIAAMVDAVKNHGAEPILYLTQAPIKDDNTNGLWLASLFLLGKMGDDLFVKYDLDRGCVQTQTVSLKKK